MFAALTIGQRVLFTAAAILAVFAAVLAYNKHQQSIGYEKAVAEYNKEKLEAIAKATEQTNEWKKKYEDSEHERSKLNQEINALSSANAASVADIGRLRVTIQNLSRRVSANPDKTGAYSADTFAALFGECSERLEWIAGNYAELGIKADRHAADAKALSDSWPK